MEQTPIKQTDLVVRPNFGKVGRPVNVRVNYFEVVSLPDGTIYQYDIDISPDVPPILNKRIFQALAASKLGGTKAVFDGRKNVYTLEPFPFSDTLTETITLQNNETRGTSRQPPENFTIKMKKVASKNLEEALRYVKGESACSNNILTAISALNILINYVPGNKFKAVGRRAFYTKEGSASLSGGVEVWPGYWQSLRPGQGRYFINFDISATAFYEPGNAAELLVKLFKRSGIEDFRRGLTPKDILIAQRFFKNLKFRVNHRGADFQRRYKVKTITGTSASQTEFIRDGQKSNVATYFADRYRRLLYPFLPCLVTPNGSNFPLEVCKIEEGQKYLRKLNEDQTREMIRFTCQPPSVRAEKIQKGVDIIFDENEYCKRWDVKLSHKMIQAAARVLPPPKITYHPSGREAVFVPKGGQWQLGPQKKMLKGETLESWSVIAFGNEHQIPRRTVLESLRSLCDTMIENGINVRNREPVLFYSNPQGDIINALQRAYQETGKQSGKPPQLIMCILQGRSVLYEEIKRIADTIIGIPTQCIMKFTLERKMNKQTAGMLGLKINVKLNGSNMALHAGSLPFIEEKPTIVFGADVSHPGPGSEMPSIAAIVASYDQNVTKYATSIRFQKSRVEIIEAIEEMVIELLKNFHRSTKRKPQRILFYRDGVGEGQYEEIVNYEVEHIRSACRKLEATYNPTITFIVVRKRHHTRMFPVNRGDVDNKSNNCQAGTVLEKPVGHPFEFDFFLLSHPGLQGTSRPTHYHVLVDDNKFDADKLQTLTYNLCYLYARCPRAVSMVSPAYYAHLAAFRARFWRKNSILSDTASVNTDASLGVEDYKQMHPKMKNIMFFL